MGRLVPNEVYEFQTSKKRTITGIYLGAIVPGPKSKTTFRHALAVRESNKYWQDFAVYFFSVYKISDGKIFPEPLEKQIPNERESYLIKRLLAERNL